jgi:adenylate cyclase
MCAVILAVLVPSFLMLSFIVVAFEKSDRYLEAAAVTVVGLPVLAYVFYLPGVGPLRLVEKWAAGHDVDRTSALDATYTYSRRAVGRGLGSCVVWGALQFVVVGAIAGATLSRLIQYGILGAFWATAAELIGIHSLWKGRCDRPGSPSPVTPGSATPCRVPGRRSPRGRTFPCSPPRSASQSGPR